jgi:hypothetical protein
VSDDIDRGEVEAGIRYIHQMEIEGRLEQTEIAADIAAIKALLIERGVLPGEAFEERRAEIAAEQRQLGANRRFPIFGPPDDKYAAETPDIPCADLLHLCRAACCNLEFGLSIQDLEEGVIRWQYDQPYLVKQDPATGKCVHFKGGCEVYDQRPLPCREFDCRKDVRIWKDFDARIPSDYLSDVAPVPIEEL